MPFKNIALEARDHIARITLVGVNADNVITRAMADDLARACLRIRENEQIRVVVITGSGDVFSRGNDQSESKAEPASSVASAALSGLSMPVIAALNGDALGGGLELALACDLRLAAREAGFGFPEVSEGGLPGGGGTQRLPIVVGKGKALELILTAQTIDADEACSIGLVSEVVPRSELAARADELAEKLASKAPIALQYAKEAINKGMDMSLGQGLKLEGDLSFLLQSTQDRDEGIRAFLEKRTARFKGK